MITTPITADLLRGALDHDTTERGLIPHRLPSWARRQCPDPQLAMAESQPSGVRVVFRTSATVVEIDALPTKRHFRGFPPRPSGVFDLFVDGFLASQAVSAGGTLITIDMATGAVESEQGEVGTMKFHDLADGVKDIEIWLPHNETIELVALRTDAEIYPATTSDRPVWVHYGSSISQGSNAATPSATYPALAASGIGADVVNLGFGGSALLDPFVARVIRDTPADMVGLEIGINIVNTDVMRLRAFGPAVHGFLDTIRDGHPEIPILLISPIYCPIHENTPGPGAFDPDALAQGRIEFMATGEPGVGKLTLTVIRDELARIVEQRRAEDPNLHYLDGLDLYGPKDHAELPLPDRLHPDAEAHARIGQRCAAAMSTLVGSENHATHR